MELTFYQDTTHGGEWHFCGSCGAKGDNLELAARVWECGIEAAATRLIGLGLLSAQHATPALMSVYLDWYVAQRARTESFWQACQKYFPRTGHYVTSLKHYLEVYGSLAWNSRGGRFVGGVNGDDLMAYAAPSRCLAGVGSKPWEGSQEAGVIPLADLPGRASGFLLVWNIKSGEFRFLHRHAFKDLRGHGSYYRGHTTGVTMLEAAFLPPSEHLGDTLFVFLDVLAAIKAQIKQLNSSDELVPIVGCRPEAPVPAILREHAPGRDVVVWAPKTDADALRYARTLNARLVTHDGRADEVRKTMSRYGTPGPWLRVLSDDALPWRKALYERLREVPIAEAEALASGLGMEVLEAKEFFDEAPEKVRARLERVHFFRETKQKVVIDGHALSEDDRGWKLVDKGEYVSEFVVRIETVYASSGEDCHLWYEGHILYDGKELPFVASEKEFEKDPLGYAYGRIVSQGWGSPAYKKSWSRKAKEISAAFLTPKAVVVPEHYGWDVRSSSFLFPEFTIGKGGVVSEPRCPPLQARRMPALNLHKPEPLSAAELKELADSKAARALWPAAQTVLRNLLAPMFGLGPIGLAATGERARSLMAAAEACGCVRLQNDHSGSGNLAEVQAVESAASWPVAMDGRLQRSIHWSNWLSSPRNTFVELDEISARVAYCRGGWHLLEPDELYASCEEPTLRELGLLARFVPDLLKHAAESDYGGGLWGEDLYVRVERLIDALFVARGLTEPVGLLADARSAVVTKGGEAEAFVRALVRLYDAGGFRVVNEASSYKRKPKPATGGTRADRRPEMFFRQDGIWTSKVGINDALHIRHHLTLDLAAVDQVLRAAGRSILAGEEEHNGEVGWVIDRKCWDLRIRSWRGGTRDTLRVVSEGG